MNRQRLRPLMLAHPAQKPRAELESERLELLRAAIAVEERRRTLPTGQRRMINQRSGLNGKSMFGARKKLRET